MNLLEIWLYDKMLPGMFLVENRKKIKIFIFFFICRTATILCKEDTHFAVLTRENYQSIISSFMDKSKNENLSFLQNLSIFKGWSLGNMEQLYFQFNIQKYSKNHVFYKEGDEADSLYFIKNGEVEVFLMKNVDFLLRFFRFQRLSIREAMKK